MKNEFTVTLGLKTLTLYSLTFRTDTKTAETATVDGFVIRRLAGRRKNFETLKGRTPYDGFLAFRAYINANIGSAVTLTVGTAQTSLVFTKGECTACEQGMCEYVIELEEVTD